MSNPRGRESIFLDEDDRHNESEGLGDSFLVNDDEFEDEREPMPATPVEYRDDFTDL